MIKLFDNWHLMRQVTSSFRDQFLTETIASALRYVDLSNPPLYQHDNISPSSNTSWPRNAKGTRHNIGSSSTSTPYIQHKIPWPFNWYIIWIPYTETESRHNFITLQGCYPDFTGSLCSLPDPTYAIQTVRRTPIATVTTLGIITGAASAAGILSLSSATVLPWAHYRWPVHAQFGLLTQASTRFN
jgi:hypothetical protein